MECTTQFWVPYGIWNAFRLERLSGIPRSVKRSAVREALRVASVNLDRLGLSEEAKRTDEAHCDDDLRLARAFFILRTAVEKIEREIVARSARGARSDFPATGTTS